MLLVLIFKTLLHNPRPFWANTDIHPEKCSDEFGDPSGHSFCAAYFMTYLYFRFIWQWAFGKNKNRASFDLEMQRNMGLKEYAGLIIGAIVLNGIHITMELSRMFLGMHSANQVILGSSMGMWTALTAVFVLRPYFEYYVYSLIRTQDLHSQRRANKIILGTVSTIALLVIVIIVVLYFTIFERYVIPT